VIPAHISGNGGRYRRPGMDCPVNKETKGNEHHATIPSTDFENLGEDVMVMEAMPNNRK
jgi:hypothetical protein